MILVDTSVLIGFFKGVKNEPMRCFSDKGITVRSTIDCLISQIALEHDLFFLHNDRDFEFMAPVIGLKLYPV